MTKDFNYSRYPSNMKISPEEYETYRLEHCSWWRRNGAWAVSLAIVVGGLIQFWVLPSLGV